MDPTRLPSLHEGLFAGWGVPTLCTGPVVQEIWLWASVLIVVLLVLVLIVLVIRRRWDRAQQSSFRPAFTLDDLRRMHGEGMLSDEEYERARARIVQRMAAAAGDRDRPPPSGDEAARSGGRDTAGEAPDLPEQGPPRGGG